MTKKSTAILFFLLASIALPQAVAYEFPNVPVRWFDADLPPARHHLQRRHGKRQRRR